MGGGDEPVTVGVRLHDSENGRVDTLTEHSRVAANRIQVHFNGGTARIDHSGSFCCEAQRRLSGYDFAHSATTKAMA